MDSTIGWVALISFSITLVLSPFLFWLIWLRNGHYEMPAILKEMNKKEGSVVNSSSTPSPRVSEQQEDQMERNLFKFSKKMIHYIFFMRMEVLLRDIGFEQTLYIIFFRRMIIFQLSAGVLISLFVFVWARLTTSNTTLILQRLIGSRDITLTDYDVNTSMLCVYTCAMTMFLLSQRKFMTSRLIGSVIEGEEKNSEHRADIFYQIRTVKIRGVVESDKKANILKLILEGFMKVNNVKGKLLKVIALPYLEQRIKLEKEKEEVLNG